MTDKPSPYKMTLSLNVLEHLGINLYSNVPSVLSEIVANAWDADALNVKITLNQQQDKITIQDNGIGMTEEEVNERFLKVGYRRRDNQNALTALGRSPMGRKGIGKLSLFSIANVVDVFTIRNGQKSALQMKLADIREVIKDNDQVDYTPVPLGIDQIDFKNGTKIVLTGLRKKKTISTEKALRKRIARRFSIIGAKENFEVAVNGNPISPADRDYYNKLQYMWTYGDQKDVVDQCSNLSRDADNRSDIFAKKKVRLTGWIGTVHESKNLKDEESGDNLNRLAIFVRGKMAQEDMLDDFAERGVYASYLIGELRFDELDQDDEEDSATSSRQSIIEDDPRYIQLKEVIGEELKNIQNKWREWRTEDGAAKALEIPELTVWVDNLPSKQRSRAKSWLGRIYRLKTDSDDERIQLLKHSVFAFEFHLANENLEALEKIDDENLDAVLELFKDLDSLEFNLYGQIVQQRVAVINTLQKKVDENDLEKAIQQYIFDHLWLLDPHWERVEASGLMEKRIDKLFENVKAKLTDEENAGRLDIKYRKTAGTHVIVELKRPNRVVDVPELTKQLEKYYSGLQKLLDVQNLDEPIQIILILGKEPKEFKNPQGKKRVGQILESYNARILFYDELLNNALRSYQDYLERRDKVDRLRGVIDAIEGFQSNSD